MSDPVRSPDDDFNKVSAKDKPWLKNYPKDVDWNARVATDKSMVDMFDESARKFGSKTCLNFMGKKYTYDDVSDMVDKMAKGFQDMGIGKGSKVGLCLPNCPQYVVSYFAALKVGATVVNFNPLYAENQIHHQIEDSKTDIMVTLNLKPLLPKIEKMLDDTRLKKIVVCDIGDALPTFKSIAFGVINTVKGWFKDNEGKARFKKDHQHVKFSDLLKSKGKPAPVQIDPVNDIAVLQYTGGTTGVPKGAALSHSNLYANTTQTRMWFTDAREGQEKLMAVLPFFHVFAMTGEMNLGLKIGAEIVMLPKFDVKETMAVISKEKPTVFAGVPTIYHAMNTVMETPEGKKKYNLTSLRHCISGGAPLPEKVKKDFEKNSGCILFEGYGLSETSPVVLCNPINGAQKTNSIGVPLPQTEVRILDLEFPDKDVPINVKGEICLRGPQVMKEYWQKPDETAKTMTPDGFFRTGDVGYMDEDGFVFIVDRIKDIIIAGGYKIYPKKIEEAIMKHDAVSEVIVAGVKDEYRGETVAAFIVLKQGASLKSDELVEFLKKSGDLSPIEMPKRIEMRDSLPKTLIGKPSRKDLLEEEARKTAKPPAP